ncbi:hypothetical protein OG225_42270 (plasmid) [Nocardia sp. NBC_01377]|uniref:hypothetical protein n=1 Tax=Nocardia sp. NBC_01377 TaxID=2903595 RepID=UPI002F91481F
MTAAASSRLDQVDLDGRDRARVPVGTMVRRRRVVDGRAILSRQTNQQNRERGNLTPVQMHRCIDRTHAAVAGHALHDRLGLQRVHLVATIDAIDQCAVLGTNRITEKFRVTSTPTPQHIEIGMNPNPSTTHHVTSSADDTSLLRPAVAGTSIEAPAMHRNPLRTFGHERRGQPVNIGQQRPQNPDIHPGRGQRSPPYQKLIQVRRA